MSEFVLRRIVSGCWKYSHLAAGNDGVCCWRESFGPRSSPGVMYYDFKEKKRTVKVITDTCIPGCAVLDKFGCVITTHGRGIIGLDGTVLSESNLWACALFSDGTDLYSDGSDGPFKIEITDPPCSVHTKCDVSKRMYHPYNNPYPLSNLTSAKVITSLTGFPAKLNNYCSCSVDGKSAELFLVPFNGHYFPAITVQLLGADPIIVIDRDTKYNNGQSPIIFFLHGVLYYTGDHNQLKTINDGRINDITWTIPRSRARITCSTTQKGVVIMCNKWLYMMTPRWHRSQLKYLFGSLRQAIIAAIDTLDQILPREICDLIISMLV